MMVDAKSNHNDEGEQHIKNTNVEWFARAARTGKRLEAYARRVTAATAKKRQQREDGDNHGNS